MNTYARSGTSRPPGTAPRRKGLIGAGIAAALVVCVAVAAPFVCRMVGRQAFERGEAAYQAGDPLRAYAAPRTAPTASPFGSRMSRISISWASPRTRNTS